jgi:F-type H+-transporting ATPase subunit a
MAQGLNTQYHIETLELAPHEPTLFAEKIFSIGDFSVTNSLLTSWVAVVILVIFGLLLRFKMKQIPGKIQNAFEVVLDGAFGMCDQVTGERKISEKVLPIALTIFFFVLVNNWLGIIPGVGTIGNLVNENGHTVLVPYLRGGTADVNTTLALALMSVIGANLFGIISIGVWKTFNKFVNLKALGGIFTKVRKDPTVLIVAPVTFFVGLIEMVGEIAKVLSLSFRLFGNVFAGEVLLASMAALVAYAIPIPFLFLEVLVGFIQALIFAMLTLVYFTIASQDHDHEEDHEKSHVHTEKAHV